MDEVNLVFVFIATPSFWIGAPSNPETILARAALSIARFYSCTGRYSGHVGSPVRRTIGWLMFQLPESGGSRFRFVE